MPGKPADPERLAGRLEAHDRRLELLRSFRRATEEALRRCQGPGGVPTKPEGGSRDLASLLYERNALDHEIGGHEALLALGRDPRAVTALREVRASPALAREAARDPRAFAKSRGIDLPAKMWVTVDVTGGRVRIQAVYCDQTFSTVLTWDGAGTGEAG